MLSSLLLTFPALPTNLPAVPAVLPAVKVHRSFKEALTIQLPCCAC